MIAIDPLERRPLGHTSLRVSRLGVGGGSAFIRSGGAGESLLDAAWKAGLRYFDTAPLYGAGESEIRFGEALAHYPRDEFVLSTKVGRTGRTTFDYTTAGVTASIARSGERLGRIDIVYLHDVDPDLHGAAFDAHFQQAIGEAYPLLAKLRDAGAIAAIGVGLKDWNVALRLARSVQLDCVMLAGGYTLLQHGGLRELLPWCGQNGVSVVVAAPYNTGILATGAIDGASYYYKPAPPDVLERTRAIEALCATHAVPLAAAALQFPLHHPAVASVVVGHEHPDEVHRNLALMRHPVPSALWQDLKAAGLIPADAPTP